MPDSIEHQEVSTEGRVDKSLLNAEWAVNESAKPGVVPTQQSLFEGASSMVDLPSSLTDEAGALDTGSEQNLRKLLNDAQKLRKASPASSSRTHFG